MSRRPPCRFYNSRGGCRAGTSCRFSHSDNDSAGATSPNPNTSNHPTSSMTPSRNSIQNDGSTSSSSSPLAPGGVCRFYWSTGNCKREFQCRYKHIRAGDHQPNTGHRSTPSTTEDANAAIAPFLTEKGLGKIGGVATDGFFSEENSTSMSPTDAHTRIRRFLFDGFKFKSVYDIYAFLAILNSANSSNKLWTPEEAQLLLTNITNSDGSLRIVEILTWPEVSTRAGSSRTVLSFQRGILPLLRYLSSEYVVKSILASRANHLYNIVLQNLDHLADAIQSCMQQAMDRRSFKDPMAVVGGSPIDTQVFASIAGLLHEIIVRFKNVTVSHPRLSTLVVDLEKWFQQWQDGINASPPLFQDPFGPDMTKTVRELIVGSIKDRISRLVSIVERERRKEDKTSSKKSRVLPSVGGNANEALVSALHTTFQGPGNLNPDGPRHDNDHEDIYDIRIAPTHEELLCRKPPFLPANFFSAPHHYPAESMQRLLDIQFRLLREELTAPLRKAVQLVYDDLKSANLQKTKLAPLLTKQGGKYHGLSDSQESIMFNVYTGVQFQSLLAGWKGLSTNLVIDTPPGRARSDRAGVRTAFWDTMGGKRLIQGGLIALLWETRGEVSVSLGIITSSFRDPEIKNFVSRSNQLLKLQICFFDPQMEVRILQAIRSNSKYDEGLRLLVESPIMFEAVRPFLEALKAEPEDLPFSKYLVHRPPGYLKQCDLEPPKYARLPGFSFQLASLFPDESEVDDLKLVVSDPTSVEAARTQLRNSKLDPSQAAAMIDTLTREVALIQGPPGTGKSFTGVEILRVLRENKIGPILMIAFTNHALDHMLSSVLDAGITYRIVRLGSRSSDERVRNYSIETLEMAQNGSRLDKAYSHHRRALKDIQKQIEDLMNKLVHADVEKDSTLLMDHLQTTYPEHHETLTSPPHSIVMIRQLIGGLEGGDTDSWQKVGKGGRTEKVDDSLYAFWKEARDHAFLMQVMTGTLRPWNSPPPSPSLSNAFAELSVDPINDHEDSSDDDSDEESSVIDAEENWGSAQYTIANHPVETNATHLSTPIPLEDSSEYFSAEDESSPDIHDIPSFLAALGYTKPPEFTSADRSLTELLDDGVNIWEMNVYERLQLHNFWVEEARRELAENQTQEFQRLRDLHTQKLTECNEGQSEARRNLLQSIDIIGCTTTGAAKLTSLLKALSPRVLLVEEAGQVMEAHILGSLVPSIEHLILIGDPLQLRPTLNNYSLSMDSRRGRELYRFDMSLMERLSTSGLAMSRIDVQRRMRPTISSLIRNTLYEGLEDHPLVSEYPDVRGMGRNVFFLNHTHPENDGGDETTSKYNTYEVNMIRDLVLYLLRQGCYSDEGDIVVLCAYLGQLARLRDALSGEIAVIIDENDQAALNDAEDSSTDDHAVEPTVARVNVTKRVRLRTVDNYQGEEGRIVILSLVRNAGDPEDDGPDRTHRHAIRSTIGFLKSENRTNVALSRAKEGLYVLGNAENLSNHSKMWGSIVKQLADTDCLGPAFPIICHRHPEAIELISEPGQLSTLAPDGGCLRPCDSRLPCGHLCPYKCHPDDPNHLGVVCIQPCRRLCTRGHPCSKVCSAECGQCRFPVSNVQLPCGHIKSSVSCWQLETLESVFCDVHVEKALPSCEHLAMLPCGMDASTYSCQERCEILMACCSKACLAKCYECQESSQNGTAENPTRITRTSHRPHPCEKDLQCGHRCQEDCSERHQHTSKCMEACRQVCRHAQCRLPCHAPCVPCQEKCTWNCVHHSCPVSCGSVCVRLPCDKRCTNVLKCGHPCPSVCGEDCSIQVCPECASPYQKSMVVDLILHRTLEDLVPNADTLDDLTITIPSCRHVFTIETLDGIASIKDFYLYDENLERWTGLTSPSGLVKPPTCPTCRAAITSPRYGRVTKRADLDILERNVAGQMSRSLNQQIDAVGRFKEKDVMGRFSEQQASLTLEVPKQMPKLKKMNNARKSIIDTHSDLPISDRDLNPANGSLFCIDGKVLDVWRKATHSLYTAYREVIKISQTRSAHIQAWESAFSFLYEREIDLGMSDPSRLPRHIPPRDHALRMARLQVGQPRPLADRRFLVEAFWSSINIRLILSRLGVAWLDEACNRLTKYTSFHRDQWANYVQFLLNTCVRDAEKAFDLAKESESHRQIVKSSLLCMRTKIERFRFGFLMHRKTGTISQHREDLMEKVNDLDADATEKMRNTVFNYLNREAIDMATERAWITSNFVETAQLIINEWKEISRSIMMDTFYQPVSYEEKMEVVKAMDFGTTGHFFTCPNGHVFSIGECGGAMETSRCPECNLVIGGADHRLHPSNRVATEFDDIARGVNRNLPRGYFYGA